MAVTLPEPVPTDASLRRALRRVRDGAVLDVAEAAVLLAARGEQLDELLAAASRIRDAGLVAEGRPGVVTYSRKVFIPLTRLCQDRCHYCTFATVPHKLPAAFLERDEVLEIARAGAAAGCKEALFTLGDRPEARWPAAREWLEERGYGSTLEYVRACAIAVLEETGLLPHLNPGVLSWEELTRLKPVAPSMGMMLETTATRLWSEPGGPHYGSPDKEPAVRLRTLTDAGRVGVPFTTGILIGIGENRTERAESIFAIRSAARAAGHVQEVIVQNFRAKPDTAMANDPDADLDDLAATIAVTRIVLGPKMRVQAPPNLVGEEFALMLRAGIDDWGGVSPVTADHVNPERPWPAIDELATRSQAAGFTLRERLTAYPRYVLAGSPWIDTRLHAHVAALAGPDGLADESAVVVGRPWQEPDGGFASTGRTDLHASIDTDGRTDDRRGDFESVYGDWDELKAELAASRQAAPERLDSDVRAGLALASSDPAALLDPAHRDAAMALVLADGAALEELCRLADDVRRDVVGDEVTYVINRNINFSNVCYVGCRFCAFAQRERDADAFRLSLDEVAARAVEAARDGATEVCVQGGIDPQLPVTFYADLVRAVKAAVPDMHVHAFSPMEIVSAAAKAGVSIEEWLTELRDAGLGSIPGTAAEILDDEVRWVLTKGKLPASQWLEVVGTAHRLGIPSSSTMMYGHVDEPRHWLGHLRTLAAQQDRSREAGGAAFTEFVPLPFVHHNAPIYLAGLARPGPTERDNRAVHAVARLALHGRIDHIQCSWVKLGDDLSADILRGGADDMGGTLMEETISRMAGSENGSARTVVELEAIATAAGRPVRQRTTTYVGSPSRLEASATAAPRLLPLTTA
ncbi:bifunctional FO biosynthesis protein CofGH [Pseudonocardia sp. KRD-184]|uniref:FO synthase n=1 Tax=Pseudonocardia oceani TaxID=2792013 RepID=A0ABS6U6K2_9PSEU|nr:bifunctional FO biosynthesis protein CofGH [Pseudonocardia oceani]MBW0088466.1 bifunctional FO biosynthesis protein CofGH [Pseudonocardia oceani]MBW0095184.1 bifunctional FO biosynthesis protein CofGH [Pseudonocardia oceani]MBW0108026.1 bifunctional FO biosynthesis protein CofGH [Pseudonocardia oceani]MBW0120734.1 bifunctional FO biosynthesis protein CofGH [Pseudonocardia oceani]MBW0127876.1 bifunctional FO biosynthesis protein CofGH [Pseudonocardia oceani]